MKPTRKFAAVLASLCSAAITADVHSEELTAEALMQASMEAPLVDDSQARALMILTLSNGQTRKRELVGWTRRQPGTTQNMRLTRFESPSDVRGMATLLVENAARDDDVWVYLPAFKKVRRVIADQKRDSFMGSDLSYGDVTGYKIGNWSHLKGGPSEQGERPCTLVISTPATDKERSTSGYSKRESCIDDASLLAARVRVWDLGGRELKEIIYGDLREIDVENGKWHAMRIEARNVQTNTRTLIEITKESINVGLSEDLFRPEYLEQAE